MLGMNQNARGDRNTEHSKVGSNRVFLHVLQGIGLEFFPLTLSSCLLGLPLSSRDKGNAHIWYRGNTTRVGMKWVLVFNSRMWRVVSWSMMKARSPYRRGSMAEGVKSLCWWATIFFHPFFFSSSYGSGDHTQGLTHARQALYHKLHP
jgi:hypothetical protein